MTVKNLEKYFISATATIEEVITMIQVNESRCVIVVADDRRVIGMFSEGDVLRAILAGIDVHAPIESLVNRSFKYLNSRDMDRALLLIRNGYTLIPVVDTDFKLTDVITLKHVFPPV